LIRVIHTLYENAKSCSSSSNAGAYASERGNCLDGVRPDCYKRSPLAPDNSTSLPVHTLHPGSEARLNSLPFWPAPSSRFTQKLLGNSERKRTRKEGRGSIHSLGLGPLQVRSKTGDVRPNFRTAQQADVVVYASVDTGKPIATTPLVQIFLGSRNRG
jgi:hypothetical protein